MFLVGAAFLVMIVALAFRRGRWADLALQAGRWAYGFFVLLALLYFPSRSGFALVPLQCQWTFDLALARHSLTNYAHIVLFAMFFLLTYAQIPRVPRAAVWAAAVTLVMGLLVELAQGVTGQGNCRMRDLIPDAVGILVGLVLLAAGSTIARKTIGRRVA